MVYGKIFLTIFVFFLVLSSLEGGLWSLQYFNIDYGRRVVNRRSARKKGRRKGM